MPWIVWMVITLLVCGLSAGFATWAAEKEMEDMRREFARERMALQREIRRAERRLAAALYEEET